MSARQAARFASVALVTVLAGSGCGLIGVGSGGGTRITAYFERAVSLFPDSQVRILGLPAGSVTSVEVEGNQVRVELEVPDGVPVPADASATIVPFSLIGERYVQLFPAYTGGARMRDGAVIPLERTTVPVEPDEALKSLRDLLDDLNPEGTRRLTENLALGLEGQGENLNAMLASVGELTRDLGSKADALGRIIDHFDEFTATLVTREAQIGRVLDDFAAVTGVLAAERDHLANIVRNLAAFAADARELVEKHGAALGDDLEVLEHVAQSLEANIEQVAMLLDTGPILATGLRNAYNPTDNVIMLRASGAFENSGAGPAAPGATADAAGSAGGLDGAAPPHGGDGPSPGGPSAPPATPFDPLDELLRELDDRSPAPVASHRRPSSSGPENLARAVAGAFGRLGDLARSIAGLS